MSEKKTIKVIKKDQRGRRQSTNPQKNVARETAREMVKTVTDWVNEFQQKRRTETAEAVKLLLPESPRTSEV